MLDPRNIKFSQESQAGRVIYQIKEVLKNKKDKILWSGSASKAEKERLNLTWDILRNQALELEELKNEISHLKTHLVILEPID